MIGLIPEELRYTKEHEWAHSENGVVTVGITDHAQHQLGDVVYLELPSVGKTIEQGKVFGVVESVKAVSDLFAPITGEVVEINNTAISSPEIINQEPYGKAWLVKVRPTHESELKELLSAVDYRKLLEAEAK